MQLLRRRAVFFLCVLFGWVFGYARLRCHTRNLEVWLINYGCRESAPVRCALRCVHAKCACGYKLFGEQ